MGGLVKLFFEFRRLGFFGMLRRRGLVRGLFGANKLWMTIGGIVWSGRGVKNLFGTPDPETVYSADVESGVRFMAVHQPDKKAVKERVKIKRKEAKKQTKVDRKVAKKQAKKANKKSAKQAKKSAKVAKRTAKKSAKVAV